MFSSTQPLQEEALVKKYKIKDRKKKKPEDIENILLMEEELSQIPRPSWWNILPVQLVRLTIFLVTGGPTLVREYLAYAREEKRRREREKEEEEEEERRIQEEVREGRGGGGSR
ncbi:hypothetical protein GWK47_008661 [Chionoecetes opilio]|uniref:Uncharacterized protein n=1 Tax=Chionoecetes opilio TaxID=41210 RepID=A0A8J5CR71_CHIOP|nr:hypothetical protein GWK47_008661 [Chionoecetes opilio]